MGNKASIEIEDTEIYSEFSVTVLTLKKRSNLTHIEKPNKAVFTNLQNFPFAKLRS